MGKGRLDELAELHAIVTRELYRFEAQERGGSTRALAELTRRLSAQERHSPSPGETRWVIRYKGSERTVELCVKDVVPLWEGPPVPPDLENLYRLNWELAQELYGTRR